MPICPACHHDIQRRSQGLCPICKIELQIYQGRLYRDGDSPPVAILSHFEQWVSRRTSQQEGKPVQFRISRKTPQYRRELVQAERLLSTADGDLEMVLLALEALFTKPQFAFKTRSSLLGIQRDFNLALAIAQAARRELIQAKKKEQEVVKRVAQREDLFKP